MSMDSHPAKFSTSRLMRAVGFGVGIATISSSVLSPNAVSADITKSTPAEVRALQIEANSKLPEGMPKLNTDGNLGARTKRAGCALSLLLLGKATPETHTNSYYTSAKINELGSKNNLINPDKRVANGFIVNQTCQVMLETHDNHVKAMYPVSTGRAGHTTPNGLFTASFGRIGMHDSSKYPSESGNGNMYYPVYFNGAIAVHGSPEMNSTSTTPQSHGCVRVEMQNAAEIFSKFGGTIAGKPNTDVHVNPVKIAVDGAY